MGTTEGPAGSNCLGINPKKCYKFLGLDQPTFNLVNIQTTGHFDIGH